MDIKNKIESILRENLSVQHIEIIDDSDKHAGHAAVKQGAGGHFSLLIISKDFEGKSHVQRHRMIYDLLKEELKTNIHALAIKAQTE